uniref:U17-Saltitoxin-Pre1a_1 n=1 Tax=Phidippus regius TaxID=1905328 RepID=A0A482ZC41_9ARAC
MIARLMLFLIYLQQFPDSLFQSEDFSSSLSELPDIETTAESGTSTPEVVGTSSKSLESLKELIHFDHIYYKQEGDAPFPDDCALSNSELSTKDCHMEISDPLETSCYVEVDSSEISSYLHFRIT